MKIQVKIGTFEETYILGETKAPKTYDGGRTLPFYESGDTRFVLIAESDWTWHEGRYGSGLYGLEEFNDGPEGWIVDKLVSALRKGLEIE